MSWCVVQLQVIRGKHLKDVTEIYQFLKRKSQQVSQLTETEICHHPKRKK